MERQEIIDFWGKDNLKRWPEASLRDVAIPDSSKSFLTEVGLPFREDWTFLFDPETDYLPQLPNKPSYRQIGLDYVVPMCLDEGKLGRVVWVEEVGRMERYINSSVERFGECLTIYQQCRRRGPVPENEIQEVVDEMEHQMRTADPSAFDDPDDFWPVIIEQMRDRLL
jgi:hypothetical protein